MVRKPVVIAIDPGWGALGWAIASEDQPLARGTWRFPARDTRRGETMASCWARRLTKLDQLFDMLELRLGLREPTAGGQLVLEETGGVWGWAGEVQLVAVVVEGMPVKHSGTGRTGKGRRGGEAGNQAGTVGPLERQGGLVLGWARRGLRLPAASLDVDRWRKWWQLRSRAAKLYGSQGRTAIKRAAVQLVGALAERNGWGEGWGALSSDEAEAVLMAHGTARRWGRLDGL